MCVCTAADQTQYVNTTNPSEILLIVHYDCELASRDLLVIIHSFMLHYIISEMQHTHQREHYLRTHAQTSE